MTERIDPEILAQALWRRQVGPLDACLRMAPAVIAALEDIGKSTGRQVATPIERTALPVTIAEPVFNEQGFSAGFKLIHPPGVDCVFPPDTKQCSCGRTEAQ